MFVVFYKPTFSRQFDKLEPALKEEILEKIELFRDVANHKRLKVHKLHGRLRGLWSFSVNYQIRIVFQFLENNQVTMIYVGNHDLY